MSVVESELVVGQQVRCEQTIQGPLRQPFPARRAEPAIHRQRTLEMPPGLRRVAERGRQGPEVVVHRGMVGGATADDDVGAGEGEQPLVRPPALFGRPDGGEH